MKIKAAVLHQINTPFSVETVELEPPKTGEVLIKMGVAGVCHSDYHLLTGDTQHPLPLVAGHEGAGVVEAVGEGVAHLRPGDRVSLNWAPNCGRCFYCLHDRPSLCETYVGPIWAGVLMDGTPRLSKNGRPIYHYCATACFAQYTVVPQECCIPLEADVPLTIAALVGCAVTTGAGAVFNTAGVKPGSRVAVFGAGGVGLNIIMAAKLAGASQIIAVDRLESKCNMARDFGATEALPATPDVTEKIRALTYGRGADYVFEAVGNPAVQEQAFGAVRPGGMLVLVGLSPMSTGTNLPGAIITRKEITVTGSYYGTSNTPRDFPFFVDLYRRGMLDLDRLVSKTYTLDQINQAYADLLQGKIARGLIEF